MKILYVGTERSDAQAVATALRGIDREVAVSWASRLDHAVQWLDQHREVAALVVESSIDEGRWPSILSQVRALPSRPILIVIVPDGGTSTFDSLDPAADDYIAHNDSLLKDLPLAVMRAIVRARELQRTDLEQKLAQATAALQDAEQRHDAALAAADAKLAETQAQYEIGMARAAATWDMVDEQLRTAALEVERARQSQAAAAAEVERLTRRDAEIASQLAEAAAASAALERRLADTEAAVEAANARTEQERQTADDRLAGRERELNTQLAEEVDRRHSVEDSLAHASASLGDAQQTIESLTARESDLNAQVADIAASRSDLERRLAATDAAFEDATTRATRDRLAASKRAAEREAELDGQIQRERTARTSLEQAIADANTALRQAEQRHQDAVATASTDLAERQARFDRELSDAASERARLADRLNETEAALDRARHDHASATADVERLNRREADLTSQLADVQAARQALDVQLVDTATALQRASARETELEEEIQRGRASQAALEQAIADGEDARRDAQNRYEASLAAAANDLAEHQARFDRELSQLTSERDRLVERFNETNEALDRTRRDRESALETIERLEAREADLIAQLTALQAARHSLEIQLDDAASAIAEELAARDALERTLADVRSDALETQRGLQEQADAIRADGLEQRARLEVQIAHQRLEHETRLADAQEHMRTTARERDALQQSLTTAEQQSHDLKATLAATLQALEIAKRHQELLQAELDQLPRLRKELDDHRAESHRLFDQAGVAMFRCTPKGALTQTNRACATLVGRRALDELPASQFAAAVFESPNVLTWLIERCVSTHSKESVETTWRRRDGGRLFVRLSARWTPSAVIEVAVEDLTRLRVLQERLGQANRMEAVGRFASEVAATCGHLLDDIQEQGHEWLHAARVDADSKQQAEQLIAEVGRAAGFVRQLAECGDEPVRTPMLVDLNTAIRDLEPVLKRVAGGDVDVQLRDTSSPLMVDVAIERVERLLVNLAGYGRQCMPAGGRLKIELGTVVVDRHFVAKHPNVRMGVHALITITETSRAARGDGLSARGGTIASRTQRRVSSKPGVDFTTLHELVNDCGGHLWMRVQPQGGMEAKVRLPLVSTHDQPQARPVAVRSSRERLTARLFQS
jgi:chromosome segregation ATPase